MFGRNVDFFAVFFIALAMLGFAEVRSWHGFDGLDSIRFGDAINLQPCPTSRQVLSVIGSMFR
jgi:hypothetical protein